MGFKTYDFRKLTKADNTDAWLMYGTVCLFPDGFGNEPTRMRIMPASAETLKKKVTEDTLIAIAKDRFASMLQPRLAERWADVNGK